jgi:hypothetical protein
MDRVASGAAWVKSRDHRDLVIEDLANENAELRAAVVSFAVDLALMRYGFLRILTVADTARHAAQRRLDEALEQLADQVVGV